MSDNYITKLTTKVIEEIQKSHSAVSKNVSDMGSELKILANAVNDIRVSTLLQTEHIAEIVEQNKVRNGRIQGCEENIYGLNKSVTSLETVNNERKERRGDVWIVGGMTVGIVGSLIGYIAYQADNRFINIEDSLQDLSSRIYDHVNSKANIINLSNNYDSTIQKK